MTKSTSNPPSTSLATPRTPTIIVHRPPSLPPILVKQDPENPQVVLDDEMLTPTIRDRPVRAPGVRTPDFVAIAADLNRAQLSAPTRSHQILRPRIGRNTLSILSGGRGSTSRWDFGVIFGRDDVCRPAGTNSFYQCARGRGPAIPYIPLASREGDAPAARGYQVCPRMKPYRAQKTTSKQLYSRTP